MKVLSYLTMLFIFSSSSPEPNGTNPGVEPTTNDSTQIHSIILIEDCVTMEAKHVHVLKSC